MTDQWVINGLPINDEWGSSCGCAPSGSNNSTVDNITITGSPGSITSKQNGNAQWSLVLNDGTPAADFRIDRFDNAGSRADSPMTIVRATGVVSFNDPVMLAADPVEPLEATTKKYVDNEIAAIGGIPEAPANGFTYGREGDTATWNVVPIEAPVDGQLYARNLRAWVSIPYPIPDAPNDGNLYGRASGAWATAYSTTNPANYQTAAQVTAALVPFMPRSGALPFTGAVAFNAGALFPAGPATLSISGGTAGQILVANGTGTFAWGTNLPDAPSDGQFYTRRNAAWAIAPGGMTDAPNDGTAYARKSLGWAHLTHSDITDWTATLAPYALTAAVPVASSTTPLMDGTAAVGTGTTWARADHVHPIPPQAIGDNRIINGNFAVNQRGYVSGTALPATPTVANGYGHDRWKAGAAGCTYTFTAALPDTTITITANTLTQIIEAGVIEGGVYTLSWTGTAQARVYQGAPTGAYAASPITTASLPAGVNTIVEFNAGTVTRVKLESGTVATPFNRQSLAKSQADCERYFRWLAYNMRFYAPIAGATFVTSISFSAMRAAPTISVLAADPNLTPAFANNASNSFNYITAQGAGLILTSSASGDTVLLGYRSSASAEL